MLILYQPAYTRVFVSRRDDFAIQLKNGRYLRARRALTEADIRDHLSGKRTYGVYVRNADGLCLFAVFDADTADGLDQLWSIQDQLAAHGIVSYVERSRRGGHLWVFFTKPALASWVRAWLLPYCPSGMEFYPKQDEGAGYGSLIRLPLGVHRKSGQCYPFIERQPTGLVALTETDAQRSIWLDSLCRVEVPPPMRDQVEEQLRQERQSFSSSWKSPSGNPSPIRQWNAEQDHFQVIGRYVQLNAKGVGQCPFGDHHHDGKDSQASFKVYDPGSPGGYCWYCYTWQRGGSLFDFLRYYYHLDAKELWQLIKDDAI